MWNKIRRIPPGTFKDLYHLLKTGKNVRQSRGAKARLEKWAIFFSLEDDKLVYKTDIPQQDLVDPTTGKDVLQTQFKTYRVIYDPDEAEKLVQTYYTTPYGGGFCGAGSIYKDLSRQIIGISRSMVEKALFKMESTQIAHSANQSILQPIVTSAVMERLQVDLIDYSKNIKLARLNGNTNYLLTCIDCYFKIIWCFPVKNKSSAIITNLLQNLFLVEGTWKILQRDNGGEFEADATVLCERFGVQQKKSLPYSSKTQGQVERTNGIIRNAVVKYMAESKTRIFVPALPSLIYAYNTKKATLLQIHTLPDP